MISAARTTPRHRGYYCIIHIDALLVVDIDKRRADPNNTVVTASTPIVVSVNSQDAVAAVTGFQMKYNKFHEFVLSSTSRCETNDVRCNLTCESEVCLASSSSMISCFV